MLNLNTYEILRQEDKEKYRLGKSLLDTAWNIILCYKEFPSKAIELIEIAKIQHASSGNINQFINLLQNWVCLADLITEEHKKLERILFN